ncbi:MAG: Hsp70 family protein [Myxococcales bacterium]|nr:Hsp70 family protein [Myxococcales bacterium]
MAWALDLGTTNTGVARWDAEADRARMVELPAICRRPGRVEPLEAPRLVPSATQMRAPEGFFDRLGRSPFFLKRVFWGRHADIGRAALEQNQGWRHPAFAPSFKQALGHAPQRTLCRLEGQAVSAREVARAFLRELLRDIDAVTATRVRDLVVTVPVESYDAYRAEVAQLLGALGVERVRFLDEPVAAALGYGVGLDRARRVLVVDFGGGTLDLAVVALDPRGAGGGHCEVLAKEGRPVGGNVVDRWLLEAFAARMDVRVDPKATEGDEALWYRLLLDETRRVKEAVYFEPHTDFGLAPPAELRGVAARLDGGRCDLTVGRADVVAALEARGLYAVLDDCADGIARQLEAAGLGEDAIDEVLMVGGSTLLPDVYPRFEQRYGRGRVRAWQPFEAVAFGACAFAADRVAPSDFLVHDYAIVTYHPETHEKQFTTIVPRGTRFPVDDVWKRQLVPTCALGEPERVFKLVVCEMAGGGERRFAWDAEGNLHRVGDGARAETVVVTLNEHNPTLGHLDPPHPPGETAPRLEIGFGVDANRWLVATVFDLQTRKMLMEKAPVVQVL